MRGSCHLFSKLSTMFKGKRLWSIVSNIFIRHNLKLIKQKEGFSKRLVEALDHAQTLEITVLTSPNTFMVAEEALFTFPVREREREGCLVQAVVVSSTSIQENIIQLQKNVATLVTQQFLVACMESRSSPPPPPPATHTKQENYNRTQNFFL